jgi:anti-anti-sigma regulatory factor
MSEFEHFDVERCDGITVIRLASPDLFDTEHYAELRRELVEFIEQQRPKKLLVLFSRVRYCSTALISALLLVKKHVETEDGLIKLSGMSDPAREVFENLKLAGTAFDIYTNESAAMEAF